MRFLTTTLGLLIAVSQLTFGQAEEKKTTPSIRIVCVASLPDTEDFVIASQDEKSEWHEYGSIKLRSSSISEWLPAAAGTLHLAVRASGGTLTSKCQFTYPEGGRRVVVILLPDSTKKVYHADVVDTAKLAFGKGHTLLVNYSSQPATVMLGAQKTIVKPGGRSVVKPLAEPNGMFRMLIAYTKESGEFVPCFDRYVPADNDSREFLLLLPDPTVGLRVFSLPEFGPFE